MLQNLNEKNVILENEIQHIYLEEDHESKHNLLLINKIKNPALLSVSLNNILKDSLVNLKEIKYANNQLMIISDYVDGISFSDFAISEDFTYDEKVGAAFTLIKLACLYSKLPNEVINDFLSTDQLFYSNGLFYTREIVLLEDKKSTSFKQLIYNISFLLEELLDPADENTTVFLEYLRNDYNQYTDFTQMKNDFKLIFIYKSKSALEVTHDFIDIQIIDKSQNSHDPDDSIFEMKDEPLKKTVSPIVSEDDMVSPVNVTAEEPAVNVPEVPTNSEIDFLLNHPDEKDKKQKKNKKQKKPKQQTKPKQQKQQKKPEKNFKELIFPLAVTLLAIICIGVLINATLFTTPTSLEASYVIKDNDGKIVFENNSFSEEPIVEYEWTIWYDGQEIKTFDSKNFAPIFSTEGTYEIVLRVKTENNWSKPYSMEYTYTKPEENTDGASGTNGENTSN